MVIGSVVALSGCAPAVPTAAAPPRATATARPTSEKGSADCTKATKVAIVDKGDGYAFSPVGLTIQRGAYLAVTNKSNAAHPLRSAPDAGMVTSVIGLEERQVIQFPEAGKFSGKTGDAVLRLTVAGDSGCGAPDPTLTIGAGKFTPAKAEVKATENFAVVNSSGDPQSVSCTPGNSKDHTRLEAGETEILALDEPGRYVCASLQHPAIKVTITVL
ncbi:hypothetical protein [Actinoplanes sp. NPDC026619]|uniref:hypothetical protein n=1 Tax=Actinoplanes sp. NPDC026619 TaxID=3155798 RepID=UPI0034018F91